MQWKPHKKLYRFDIVIYREKATNCFFYYSKSQYTENYNNKFNLIWLWILLIKDIHTLPVHLKALCFVFFGKSAKFTWCKFVVYLLYDCSYNCMDSYSYDCTNCMESIHLYERKPCVCKKIPLYIRTVWNLYDCMDPYGIVWNYTL